MIADPVGAVICDANDIQAGDDDDDDEIQATEKSLVSDITQILRQLANFWML